MVLPETVLLGGSIYIEIYGAVSALKTRTSCGTLTLRTLEPLATLLKSIYGMRFGAKPLNPGTIIIFFAIIAFVLFYKYPIDSLS